jgi:cytochrome c biogenesis protein CcdA
MTEIGLLAAFAAGLLALLSPCSALLLPSFFAYAFASPTAMVLRTGVFYAGLLVTLVPLGVGASAASQLFYGHRSTLIAAAGWTIVGLGVLQVVGRGFRMPFTARLQGWAGGRGGHAGSWVSTLALGAVYGLAGFCSGPVLGAILTVAATQTSPFQGALLLAVYALGMAAPLLALALLWERFDLSGSRLLRGREIALGRLRVHSTSVIAGMLFIVIGGLFLRYDGTAGVAGVFGLGDTTDLESTAQQAVARWTAGVPGWAVAAVVAAGAGLVAWRRSRRTSDQQPS